MVATLVAFAHAAVFAALDPAAAGEPNEPAFLLFAGTDLWRFGAFIHGGTVWSPNGLDADGFTFKTLISTGRYTYTSGGLHADVTGTMVSGALLPGWHFQHDGLSVSLYAGPVVQNYWLRPNDPGSRLHGFYVGGQFAADLWYQPTPGTMVAVNGAIASIGPTGSLRIAFGFRFFEPVFIGPENQEIWSGNFQEVQLGAHVTSLRIGAYQWSAGGGWAMTSDQRQGPYLRLGVNARF